MRRGITRRGLVGGGLAFSACGASATPARRTVETPLGRLDIPVAPRRVLAVDSRISLESALALELPVVGYSHSRARPWVPVPAGVPMLAAPPDLEQILMLKPDLILCPDTAPYSDWWPLARLAAIAPVLPSNHRLGWQVNLARLAGWLALTALAEPRLAAHEELVASIRRRHGAAIASMRVAALYFDPLKRRAMVCSDGTAYGRVMPAQVLAELGGREVDAGRLGPSGDVALEAFGDVFGDVDALLVLDFGDGSVGALAGEALWQRLPAVRAGHVHIVAGNCTFGSFYTAQYLADAWAALYARAEA